MDEKVRTKLQEASDLAQSLNDYHTAWVINILIAVDMMDADPALTLSLAPLSRALGVIRQEIIAKSN